MMTDREQNSAKPFGCAWTLGKLGISESYLDAYTTALKDIAKHILDRL
ncbi:MAG: hypothetical protein OXL36_21790 [Bryobacterales bacterium]|nr:hypothetical protein [Bryobacterales bacterium]MDE0292915.1 hypothetical protein [Bryobacterales bacterium]